MILIDSQPCNNRSDDADFTMERYRGLLRLAKQNYHFTDYGKMPQQKRFVFWRHDCDASLNRALKLATIEREENIKSTFFINLHCGLYNLLEAAQSRIVAGNPARVLRRLDE